MDMVETVMKPEYWPKHEEHDDGIACNFCDGEAAYLAGLLMEANPHPDTCIPAYSSPLWAIRPHTQWWSGWWGAFLRASHAKHCHIPGCTGC